MRMIEEMVDEDTTWKKRKKNAKLKRKDPNIQAFIPTNEQYLPFSELVSSPLLVVVLVRLDDDTKLKFTRL